MKKEALISLCACLAVSCAATDEKPNIIYIMADDLGYGDLSCYGAEKISTPNIDKLANDGVRFTDAHSPASVSTPTRYGVLTGRYCWRGRLKKEVLWCGYTRSLIEPSRKTIGNMMQESGYHTAQIGKWHLGWEDKEPIDYSKGYLGRGPKELGFDYSFVTASAHNLSPIVFVEDHKIQDTLESFDYLIYEKSLPKLNESMRNWHAKYDLGPLKIAKNWEADLVDSIYTAKTIKFIEDHVGADVDEQFYIHLTPEAPHLPNRVPDFLKGSSGAGERGDHVQMLDWMVGEIVASLDKLGIRDNTMIIFTSDNGAIQVGVDGKNDKYQGPVVTDFDHGSCGDLKGFKAGLFEGGHRVPFIVSWPGKIKNGVSDNLISSVDVMATLATLVDYKLSDDMGEDSFNILPHFYGATDDIRATLIHQHYNGQLALREGDWVYFKDHLYNLKDDLYQDDNLIASQPERAEKMQKLLDEQVAAGRTR